MLGLAGLEGLMTYKMLTAIALMACGLAGCATGPGLTGNSAGGIIPWTPENRANAREWAKQHCAQYGEVPQMRYGLNRPGEYIAFDCEFPKSGPSFRYSR
jgi:hypothetical protein